MEPEGPEEGREVTLLQILLLGIILAAIIIAALSFQGVI